MRAKLNNAKGEIKSSFLSCEKDAESIIRKLFVENRPYSDYLKRLLLINTNDCLIDMENPAYIKKIKETSIQDLCSKGYINFVPKLELDEHDECKCFIIITFDNFIPCMGNEYFRDCIIEIDILCHPEYWDVGNFRQRPLKIAGYVDGILNKSRLSGLGTLNFLSCDELTISQDLIGYCLMYAAVHGNDDTIEGGEENAE